jgi:small subunit ribosomal protein S6
MRAYELVLIVHPELDESAFNEVLERVTNWITDSKGEVIATDLWGKRTLAYPIRKLTEGQYVLLNIRIDPSFGVELERNLRFLEPIIRFSLIAKQDQ